MTGNTFLTGITVLMVEDNFYLAEDQRQAIEDAGGRVLGPCPSAAEALALLCPGQPDCAVLDISLSDGPSFDLARVITIRGIPVLFITGYDAPNLPPDLRAFPTLHKPISMSQIVEAVGEMCRTAHR